MTIGPQKHTLKGQTPQQDVLVHLFFVGLWGGFVDDEPWLQIHGSYCYLLIAADGFFVCFFTRFVSVCLLFIHAQHKLIISVLSWSRFKKRALQPEDTT